jgi:hypothetical protein
MRKLKQIRADIALARTGLAHASGARAASYREEINALKGEERIALIKTWSWEEVQLEAKRLGIPGYSLLARSKLEALITEAHS